MGRSVSVPSRAQLVAYAPLELDEDYELDFESEVIEPLRYQLTKAFPSLYEDDDWLDREDHVILKNRHAQFGISEYCGLLSIWAVPYNDDEQAGLHAAWLGQIAAKFGAVVQATFGTRLVKCGSFSNGEGFYQAVS